MAKRLVEHLTTNYLGAAQALNSKSSRRKIVAYVESYDDILFWRSLLSEVETDKYYFEVMLPSRDSLLRGKKSALMNTLGHGLGQYMIACVDADYDYLMQDATDVSRMLCKNPYVFHTYTYAIENYQCFSPSLHNVCVMATLNDHAIFDFEAFLTAFSRIVFPLFVWSVWCYRNKLHSTFSMLNLCQIIEIREFNIYNAESILEHLAGRVNVKVSSLQHQIPQAKGSYQQLSTELQQLGVTPETTYLYMRGHDIFDKVVVPVLDEVCTVLRREREREIRRNAQHQTQCMNELSGYQHASAAPEEMMRKQTAYRDCDLYRHIVDDIRHFIAHAEDNLPNEPILSPEPYESHDDTHSYRDYNPHHHQPYQKPKNKHKYDF